MGILDDLMENLLKDFNHSKNHILEYTVHNYKLLDSVPIIKIKSFTFLFGPNGSGKSTYLNSIRLLRNRFYYLHNGTAWDTDLPGSYLSRESHSNIIRFEIVLDNNTDIISGNYRFEHPFYSKPSKVRVSLEFELDSNDLKLYAWHILDFNSKFELYMIYPGDPSECTDTFIKITKPTRNLEDESVLDAYPDELKILSGLNDSELELISKIFSIYLRYIDNLTFFLNEKTYYGVVGEDFYLDEQLLERDWDNIKKEIIKFAADYNSDIDPGELGNLLKVDNFIDVFHYLITPYYLFIKSQLLESFNSMHYIPGIRYEVKSIFRKREERSLTPLEVSIYRDLIKIYESGYNNNPSLDTLNKMMKELNLADNFIIEARNAAYEVYIEQNGKKILIDDCSSGFKQIFPVLLRLALVDSRDLFLIEQPELHLHPKLQTAFIEVLQKYRNDQRYIIETHSEHMVRKIQVLIAKGLINRTDVAVYYFSVKGGKTQIKEMIIGENGYFLEPWPDGFFDDSYNLTKELIFAQKN